MFGCERADQVTEHVGDHVLAAVGEGCDDPARGARLDHLEGAPHEVAGGRWTAARCERLRKRRAARKQVQQPFDRARVGARVPHALEIQLKVRRMAAAR